MSEISRTRTPEDGRISTGTAQLDEMLNGGLVPHRPYLVVGPSGTGKTTLALEFLCEGVRNHEPTLIVTMEEPPNEMRFNHRSLQPELDQVWVFDAIPDVMRYERAPFKDVAQVRDAVPFAQVAPEIRKTPELTSVEITLTSLEQTLKMQSARRNYTRLVIDSLTALQYFCMKGIDEVQGAQSFLRFLSDLGPTTLLTVESPHEDVETPERMLARGEIRLFRWELEGATVRAVGVEKFRGSSHDVRLHPYRIGRQGIDINLADTISRDTRRVLQARAEAPLDEHVAPIVVTLNLPGAPGADPVGVALDGIAAEIAELKAARLDLAMIRGALDSAHASLATGQHGSAQASLVEVRALVHQMALGHWSSRPDRAAAGPEGASVPRPPPDLPPGPMGGEELHRSVAHLARALGPAPPIPAPAPAAEAEEPPAPPAPVPEPLPSMAELSPVVPPPSPASTLPSPAPPPPPPRAPTPEPAAPPEARPLPHLPGGEAPPAAVSFGPTFETLAPPPADRPVTESVPTSPAAASGDAPVGVPSEAPSTPKRRRRTPGTSPRRRARPGENAPPSGAVGAEASATDPAPPGEPPAPRKRASRKRKAAPVPNPVQVPAEATSPTAAPEPAPSPPPEGVPATAAPPEPTPSPVAEPPP